MNILKVVGIVFVGVILFFLTATTLVSIYYNWQARRKPEYNQFTKGIIPDKAPDGSYSGKTEVARSSWLGKKFDGANSTGINNFEEGERYPFHTYVGPSLTNSKQQVFKIDYNQAGNPIWLKFIVDEVVQIEPGHFLGKIQINIIPGLAFTIGYFTLQQ